MEKKTLLVYAHYFYPDVASTGQILTELCEGLNDTFKITVICTVPSYSGKIDEKYKSRRFYKEYINGIEVIRVRVSEFSKKNKISRIKNLLSYFLNSILITFKLSHQDYIFSISQPPILGGMLGVIGKILKGGKFIYNIQDFNPEQTKAIGYSKNKFLLKIALILDKFSCNMASEIIVVGRDMQETLKKRFNYNHVPKNVFINNWIDENEIYPLDENNIYVKQFKKEYGLLNKFIIMYSGNIGLYYDLENLIKVIEKFKDRKDIIFAFVGDGTVKDKLLSYAENNNMNNVKFIPYQIKKELIYSLNAADIHFVVNAKGIKGISVPSKLYGVMACGKPVIGVLEENSEGRIIIEESNCGFCCTPKDYNDIYQKVKFILDNKDKIRGIGLNGRRYLENNLSKRDSILKYKKNILSV